MNQEKIQTKQVTVINEKENSKTVLEFTGKTVKELLILANVNFETVIVTRNNEVLLKDDILENDDVITLLSVISGG